MANSNESIADVLAEMRADEIETEDGVIRLDGYADRIEEAVKREREETKDYFAKLHDGPSMICTAKNCSLRNAAEDIVEQVKAEASFGHFAPVVVEDRPVGNAAAMRDILEKIRREYCDGPLIEDYADRIEAAAERERDEDRQLAAIAESDEAFARCARCDRPERATGNAAALREALNRVEHLANDLRNITERDTEVRADVNEIVDVCRAALAAPARNCDRFATADDARRAFESAHSHGIVHNLYTAAFDWLFAPAKGGAK